MDITKKNENTELQYYYSENGSSVGPFNVAQLLERITPEQLVWRDGIEWTAAKDVPDLSKFFQKVVEKVQVNNTQSTNNLQPEQKVNPMFSAPFSFNGRIRRMEYGISLIIYYFALFIASGLAEESTIFGILYLPLIWFILAQGAKRCHDRDNSGWYQIIPFYVLWLLFAEGDRTSNSYGNPAK